MIVYVKYTTPALPNNDNIMAYIRDTNNATIVYFTASNAVRANTAQTNMISGIINPILGTQFSLIVFKQSDSNSVSVSNVVWTYAFA
jgi:hypothetical protein